MEKINEAWKNASEEMYKAEQEAQAGGAGAAEGQDASAATEDDVQDVDFEEVEEEK